jgi:hypothetical protein
MMIVPFGKYRASENGFRIFLIAVVVWSLMFAFIFSVISVW